MFPAQFWRALAHYGILFPDLASLGAGNPPAAWKVEYDRVSADAFSGVIVTNAGSEGETSSGTRNFAQEVLVDALHCRRFQLDATYVLPPLLADFAAAAATYAAGFSRRTVIQFSP